MSLEEIFSDLLLDHSRHPRHLGKLEDHDVAIEGANPLCGDEIELYVKFDGDRIKDVGFTGTSCAICTASTSMFCEQVAGGDVSFPDELHKLTQKLLRREDLSSGERARLGDILALQGVSKLPSRVKCALLVYETWELAKKQLVSP